VGPYSWRARRGRDQHFRHQLHTSHGALQAQRADRSALQGVPPGVQGPDTGGVDPPVQPAGAAGAIAGARSTWTT
ncbi:unnamed protein product, partial [Scytosiphon promiscuus]